MKSGTKRIKPDGPVSKSFKDINSVLVLLPGISISLLYFIDCINIYLIH